jgi:hypothetical protein
MAARSMNACLDVLRRALAGIGVKPVDKMLIGTVKALFTGRKPHHWVEALPG